MDGLEKKNEGINPEISGGEIEALRSTIRGLQGKISEMEKAHAAQINSLKCESAVDLALFKAGAKNVRAVRGLIELPEPLELDDEGNIRGLAEAISAVKKSDGYLFEDKSEVKISGAVPAESGAELPDFSRMTYSEISEFMAKNPGVDLGLGGLL